ncbi:MAG: hypothetical protein ACOYOS_05895 [Syntrophales bacterium]
MKTKVSVSRLIENRIAERIGKGKVILVFGPRRWRRFCYERNIIV